MKDSKKYYFCLILLSILCIAVTPIFAIAGRVISPDPPSYYSGTVNPDYYIIYKGKWLSGDIEDCQAMDGDFIQFKGITEFLMNRLAVHFYFGDVGQAGINNKICIKFRAKTYALKYWVYYWDGTFDMIPPEQDEIYGAFYPEDTWLTEYYTIDNYKEVSDVYIYCTSSLFIPEIKIDYLAVIY